MRAIFIAVGSELLERDAVDTNSLYVSKRLRTKGILMDMKAAVSDNLENMIWLIKSACKKAQIVVITGGLGPTEDDLTREAVARVLKRKLIFQEEILEQITKRFKFRGIKMPQINIRQAFVIEGAEVLVNEVGTAPGLYLEEKNCKIILLPGPPREMIPIFEQVLKEKLAPLSNYHIYTRNFKLAGITESETDAMIAEIYTKYQNPRTTILASPGIIEVSLLGRSKNSVTEAKELTDELAGKILTKIRDFLVTEKDITLEQYIVEELKIRGLTLSTAESCTGGGLGNRITNVAGSSEIFLGGVVAYSNDLKNELLKVKKETLEKYGAVSQQTAKEMAEGVRAITGSDIGVSITGIAGPEGGSKEKPVGLVFMYLSSEKSGLGTKRIFTGDRNIIKARSENFTFNLIREYLHAVV